MLDQPMSSRQPKKETTKWAQETWCAHLEAPTCSRPISNSTSFLVKSLRNHKKFCCQHLKNVAFNGSNAMSTLRRNLNGFLVSPRFFKRLGGKFDFVNKFEFSSWTKISFFFFFWFPEISALTGHLQSKTASSSSSLYIISLQFFFFFGEI